MAVKLIAEPDSYSIGEDDTLTVAPASGVLANDFQVGGGRLGVLSNTAAAHGTLSVASDGALTYVPDAGFTGIDTFTYTVSNRSISASATGTITVFHAPPVAIADDYVMQAGGSLTVTAARGVLANDLALWSGATLTATSFGNASHGDPHLDPDGSFTYTPDAGFVGTDSFTYFITDGTETASATATVDVVDAAPVANADYYAVRADGTLTVTAATGVLANDEDPDNTLTATTYTDASHGNPHLDPDGSFTYTPDAGFVGADSFTYFVSDGTETASAAATIQVVDTAPVANTDFYRVLFDGTLTVTPANGLLLNDFDPNGDTITALNYGPVAHGTINVKPDGSFVYTPNSGFVGSDSFTYTISDGALTATGTADLTVSLLVLGHPGTPIANPDFYAVQAGGGLTITAATGVLANDVASGAPLTATRYTDAAHGQVNLQPDGSLTYTPDAGFTGADTFTYFISNGSGTADTTDTIDVYDPPPLALPDVYTVKADQTLTVTPQNGVLANDLALAPGATLTATKFSNASHGDPNLKPDGSFSYTPDVGYVGPDSFTYYISDGQQTAAATATINVVDAAPIANPDNYAVRAGATLVISAANGVLANDYDADDPLVMTSFSAPPHGSLDLNADGSFSYVPNAGFAGVDSFTYDIGDGVLTSSATDTIAVLDHVPVAAPDFYHVYPGGTLTVAAPSGLLANDYDPDGDSIIASGFEAAAHGTVVVDETGSFVYVPEAGFKGTDTFTYSASDGALTSTPATVTVVVACFAADTRILTALGEIAVQDLRVGDLVVCLRSGRVRPIRWIGHRHLRCDHHAQPERAWPIRIRAGAFADGVPHRDLRLSPDHAIFVDGVLVPASYLVNGSSIAQEACTQVTYWHVELAAHEVVVADGLPTESYLDTGNRAAFAYGGKAVMVAEPLAGFEDAIRELSRP